MQKMLENLCQMSGISSYEEELRAFLEKQAAPFATSIRVDTLGNLIVFKRGEKSTGEKLMLAAHMDEVGLMIRSVTEDGYLKFVTVGGIDRRVLIGKRVLVGKTKMPGIIGLKAHHLVSAEEGKKIPKLSDFYIDIGAESAEEVKNLVSPGDAVVFDQGASAFGEGMFWAKAIDDRIGCSVMLELLKQSLPMDCTFVFTVQEEVGTRGALAASFSVKPEIALVLEGTTAADIPSMEAHKKVCILGSGPVIPFMDGGSVYDRGLYELLRELAIQKGMRWQTKHYISGGTDASAIHTSKEGVRVVGISAPVRYLHTPTGVIHLRDMKSMQSLAYAFIEAIAALS
jgi:endoglucanase